MVSQGGGAAEIHAEDVTGGAGAVDHSTAEVAIDPDPAEGADQQRAEIDEEPPLRHRQGDDDQADDGAGEAGERDLEADEKWASRAAMVIGEVPFAPRTSGHS